MVQVTTTGTLILDESAGNTENDTNLTNANPALAISADFLAYLTSNSLLTGIIEEAKGLSITVDPEGSAISSLGFTKADGTPFSTTVGTQVIDTISGLPVMTIGGEAVYLFGTSDPDVVVAKDASGDLVAVFYLNDAGNNLSASVEMVAYQALEHHDAAKGGGESAGDQDLLDWGNQLSVSAMGSLEFNFNNLDSGKFTWVAVGTDDAGMIVTGSRLNIAEDGTRAGSGKTASDAMNTSQGGDGATIGVDNQMFTPGDSAIFTLVKGFGQLPDTTSGDATGQDVDDIIHNGYLDTGSCELFISQKQGNDKLDISMSIFEAGKNGDDEDADAGAGGAYAPDGAVFVGSGSNQTVGRTSTFSDDAEIPIDSVEVRDQGVLVGIWTTDSALANQSSTDKIFLSAAAISSGAYAGIKVTITGNDCLVENVDALYSIKIIADNNETFNRIELGSQVGNFDIGKFFIEQGVGDTDVIGDDIRTDDDRPALDGDSYTGHVDEDELTGASIGNTDSDLELTSFTYSHANLLTILSAGVDTPIHFSLDTTVAGGDVKDVSDVTITSKGVDVVWVNNGGVLEGWTDETTSRKVFTLEHHLNDDPGTADDGDPTDDTFTFTLHDQIDHADGSGDEAEREINLTPAFNAADDDGDPALNLDTSTAIRAAVENDVPAAKPNVSHSEEVFEDALTGGNPDGDGETETISATYTQAELSALADVGADEDLVFSLNTAASGSAGAIIGTNVVTTGGVNVQCKGEDVMWAAGDSAGSLKGVVTIGGVTTTVFTLTPSGNDFALVLVDQVDHSGAEDDQELLAIDLTSAFQALDFDKDPLTLDPDSVVLNVENDLPTFSAQILSKTLDWVDENSVSSSLNGDVGADEPASYVIDKYTDLAGYTESLSADGKTLTYVKDGKTYFTLALDDSANSGAGGYTFTINEPPPQEKIEFNFDNLESGNFLWVAVGGLTTSGAISDTGLLVTGSRLNLKLDGTSVSGKAASDQVNTSQGGAGATIGIDNQMFTPGDSGIFTFVKDFDPLAGTDGDATGQDIDQILHDGYANVGSASLFISQKQGNTKLDLTMSIYEAGSGAGDEDSDGSGSVYASGGSVGGTVQKPVVNKSATFLDDVAVALDSVEIRDENEELVGIWTTDFAAADASGSDNIYRENTVGAEGIIVDIKTDGRAGNSVLNSADINGVDAFYSVLMVAESGETFNRIELQADSGKFDIGKFVLEEGQDTPDIDLEFSVAIEDKDGDLNNFDGTNDVFDDFKIKVDGTGINNDPDNVAPTGFTTSYDTASTLTSLSLKNPGFVDDSGMAPSTAIELSQEPWLI